MAREGANVNEEAKRALMRVAEVMPGTAEKIVTAITPILQREERVRIREALQPLFDAIDSPDGEVPPFQPISDEAQRAFAFLADPTPQPADQQEGAPWLRFTA